MFDALTEPTKTSKFLFNLPTKSAKALLDSQKSRGVLRDPVKTRHFTSLHPFL
jgi:hypothetical protein